jgi:hypothetical protein
MKYMWMVLIIAIVFSSCKKYSSCEGITTDAVIVDSGPIEADGCGWAVKVGDNVYHPSQLDAVFRENNLQVRIRYKNSGKNFVCGIAGIGLPEIDLLYIRKK